MSRAFDLALQANQEVPPTREEANRKKPNWGKIERSRRQLLEFIENYRKGHSHPHLWEKYMGLTPMWEEPTGEMQTHTKEFREQRAQEIREMEARLVEDMYKIHAVHGNVRFDQMQPS